MPLNFVGLDSAELRICCCPRVGTSAILQEHIANEPYLHLEELCKDYQQSKIYTEKGGTENESQSLQTYPALPLAHYSLFKSRPDLYFVQGPGKLVRQL